jgi:capsular polysaccharide biosynthesis protein
VPVELSFAQVMKWCGVTAVVAVLCGGVAYGASRALIQPTYTATVSLAVQPGISINDSPTDPAYSVTLAQTYAAVAQLRPMTQAAYAKATGDSSATQQDAAITHESPSTACNASALTALFYCSVSANSALYAATATNDLAIRFIGIQRGWTQHRYWNVTVASPARVPTSPASPHSKLNALVAFMLALLILGGAGWLNFHSPSWIRSVRRRAAETGKGVQGPQSP